MEHAMTRAAAAALLGAALLAACQKAPPPANAAPANTAASNAAASNATPFNPAESAASADKADAADAKAFLESLYAHYKSSKNNTFNMFDTNKREVFDPDTIALLAADTKALKGDLGAIDGDYLCDCQDFVSLQTTVKVQSATPTSAKATADFTDVGMPGQGARHAAFDLLKVNGAWRIHDISNPDQPSLRQTLQTEIASLKNGTTKPVSGDEAP